jgi:hypothetical protein
MIVQIHRNSDQNFLARPSPVLQEADLIVCRMDGCSTALIFLNFDWRDINFVSR